MRVERIILQTITPLYSVLRQNNPYMRKLIAWSIFSLLFCFTSQAQIKKVLHKTYEIDSAQTITFDFVGEYVIEKWAGSTVLTETSVELYDANINIYRHFLKDGRYDIDLDLTGEIANFISHDKIRPDIKTAKGQCWEIIKLKVYIPQEFTIVDQTRMTKSAPTAELNESAN